MLEFKHSDWARPVSQSKCLSISIANTYAKTISIGLGRGFLRSGVNTMLNGSPHSG